MSGQDNHVSRLTRLALVLIFALGAALIFMPRESTTVITGMEKQSQKETKLEAVAGNIRDEAVLHFTPDPVKTYKLNKKIAGGGNWT